MLWTKEMYQYLSLKTLKEVFNNTADRNKNSEKVINELIEEIKAKLDLHQINYANHRLRKIKHEYRTNIYEEAKSLYGDRYGDDDEYYYPAVEYDEKIHDVWVKGVKERTTIEMTYDSTTSGLTKRLVDPYQTRSPYGQGYCHLKKEVRKFRFDRIVEIALTDLKFTKPKSW